MLREPGYKSMLPDKDPIGCNYQRYRPEKVRVVTSNGLDVLKKGYGIFDHENYCTAHLPGNGRSQGATYHTYMMGIEFGIPDKHGVNTNCCQLYELDQIRAVTKIGNISLGVVEYDYEQYTWGIHDSKTGEFIPLALMEEVEVIGNIYDDQKDLTDEIWQLPKKERKERPKKKGSQNKAEPQETPKKLEAKETKADMKGIVIAEVLRESKEEYASLSGAEDGRAHIFYWVGADKFAIALRKGQHEKLYAGTVEDVKYVKSIKVLAEALLKFNKPAKITIHTNEKFILDMFGKNGKAAAFAENGWKKEDGSDVAHAADWRALYDVIVTHKSVSFDSKEELMDMELSDIAKTGIKGGEDHGISK